MHVCAKPNSYTPAFTLWNRKYTLIYITVASRIVNEWNRGRGRERQKWTEARFTNNISIVNLKQWQNKREPLFICIALYCACVCASVIWNWLLFEEKKIGRHTFIFPFDEFQFNSIQINPIQNKWCLQWPYHFLLIFMKVSHHIYPAYLHSSHFDFVAYTTTHSVGLLKYSTALSRCIDFIQ